MGVACESASDTSQSGLSPQRVVMIPIITPLFFVSCTLAANEVQQARTYIYEAVPGGVGTNVIGIIDFEQTGTLVKLNGSLSGLSPGLHGFHVHEKGDIGNGCLASGGHFNPHKMDHGAPSDANRHVGDLGNINTPPSGDTIISVSDSLIALSGLHSIIGRAVVVHEKPDDLGKGGTPDSLKTGNAGARIACGVIGILDEVEVFTTVAPLAETTPNYSTMAASFLPLLTGLLLVLRHI